MFILEIPHFQPLQCSPSYSTQRSKRFKPYSLRTCVASYRSLVQVYFHFVISLAHKTVQKLSKIVGLR